MKKGYKRGRDIRLAKIMSPCKGCSDRQLQCHAFCSKYKKYKEDTEAVKKAFRTRECVDIFTGER